MSEDYNYSTEDRLQYDCIQWATDKYKELRQWSVCSYPSGGYRDKVTAQKMRSTGQKAGVPDLIFFLHNRIFFIELKLPTKRAQPIQLECHEYLRERGFMVYLVDSFEKFKIVVEKEMKDTYGV